MAIINQTLTTSGSNIFICPADQEQAITCVVFCNTSADTVLLNVYAVPATAVSVSTASQIIKNLELPASETFTFDTEKFVFGAGDRLHAVASAGFAVTATVSSMRVS